VRPQTFSAASLLAASLDLLPIVRAIPMAIRPTLDLIDPLCLHGIPRFPCRRRYESFLAIIGLGDARIVKSAAALSPNSAMRGEDAVRQASAGRLPSRPH